MGKELNVVKWNHPNWSNMNCYSSKEISGEVGDIIEDKWIVVDGGKHAVKLVNLTLVDIIEVNFPLEHPYLEFDYIRDNLTYRYHVNHSEIKKVLDKNSVKKERIDVLKNIKRNVISRTHGNKILDDINKKYSDNHIEYIENIYKLAQAQIMALLLNQFYDENYKVSDVKSFFKASMDNDKELKNYVYEIMKDY